MEQLSKLMYEIIKHTFAEDFRVWHTFPINNEEINGIQML